MEPYIRAVDDKHVNLKGYTLILGFPGMGFVGTIAAKHLIDKLDMKMETHFESNFTNPVLVIHKGEVLYPTRIYASHKKKIAVMISEQAIPKFLTTMLADEIITWAKKHKIKTIVSFEGIKSDTGGEIQKVYGLASEKATEKMLEKIKVPKVNEGLTSGVSAFMLLKARNEKSLKSLSLLGNVHSVADYEAAAECLKKANDLLDIKIDVGPLLEEAKQAKALLLQQLSKIREETQKTEAMDDTAPMYT